MCRSPWIMSQSKKNKSSSTNQKSKGFPKTRTHKKSNKLKRHIRQGVWLWDIYWFNATIRTWQDWSEGMEKGRGWGETSLIITNPTFKSLKPEYNSTMLKLSIMNFYKYLILVFFFLSFSSIQDLNRALYQIKRFSHHYSV